MRMRMLLVVFLTLFMSEAQASPSGEDLAQARSMTLVVRSDDLDNQFLGSAFVFLNGQTVITNAHVVEGRFSVILIEQNGARKAARVAYVDSLRDIAVLIVETAYEHALSASAMDASEAQLVFAIGAPLGEGFSISSGIISALNRQKEPTVPVGFIQHDAAINPGSSGGPLVGLDGTVLGMNTQIADGSRYFIGLSYAIPVSDLLDAVKRAENGTRALRPEFGLRVRPVTAKVAAALNLENQSGVLVDHVIAGDMADLSGIRSGDILLSVSGIDLTKPGDLAYAIEALTGDLTKANVRILRQGKVMSFPLVTPPADTPVLGTTRSGAQKRMGYRLDELGLMFSDSGVLGPVEDSTLARSVGLAKDDVVLAINGVAVSEQKEGWNTRFIHTGPVLLLMRLSDGSTRHFMVDPWTDQKRLIPVGSANILDQDVVVF